LLLLIIIIFLLLSSSSSSSFCRSFNLCKIMLCRLVVGRMIMVMEISVNLSLLCAFCCRIE
jgi:hypothetical protein